MLTPSAQTCVWHPTLQPSAPFSPAQSGRLSRIVRPAHFSPVFFFMTAIPSSDDPPSFPVLQTEAISRHPESASTPQTSIQFPVSHTFKGQCRCSGKGKPASVNAQVRAVGSCENLHAVQGSIFTGKLALSRLRPFRRPLKQR